MPSEKMRLEAEMRDSASPQIRKLRKELEDLQNATRETRALGKLNKEIEQLRKESGDVRATSGMRAFSKWVTESSKGAGDFVAKGWGISSAMNAIGIGGLTAAAGLTGLTAQIKELGNRVLAMKELGREIGMTVDDVNAFAHAGAHFGVGADVMSGALDHLAGQMPEFRRNQGSLYHELSRWPDLIKRLQRESSADQIKDIFGFLGQQKLQNEPQLQKQLLGAFFGSGDQMEKLFAQGAKGFLDELSKQAQQVGKISPDMLKQALAFRDAQTGFTDALEKFENSVGPRFLSTMTAIVEKATQFFSPDHKAIAKRQYDGGRRDEHLGTSDENMKGWLSGKQSHNPYGDLGSTKGLFHKSSYSGAGGLLHLASYGDEGSAGGGGHDILSDAVKSGFLAAMRELMAQQDLDRGGGGGGLLQASYTGAGGGFGAGIAGRGLGGSGSGGLGPGTAVDKTLPKEARALLDTIAAGEAHGYDVLNGGGRFSDYSHHPGGRAAGRYQDLPSTWRRIANATALRDFSPESQDKGNWWLAQQDYRARTHRDLLADLRSGNPRVIAGIGRALHSTWISTNGAFASRYAGALAGGAQMAGGASYPGHIGGNLSIEGENYRFGSGGVRGSTSIPFGDYPITPGAIGGWGQSHGALGINGNAIYDRALGRMRQGIEMHAGHSVDLITEGCLAFEKARYPQLRAHVLAMIKRNGHAYLHVGPHGASITARRADGLTAPHIASGAGAGSSHHQLDIHLHDKAGAVRSVRQRGEGPMQVKMKTWPTMTEASYET